MTQLGPEDDWDVRGVGCPSPEMDHDSSQVEVFSTNRRGDALVVDDDARGVCRRVEIACDGIFRQEMARRRERGEKP